MALNSPNKNYTLRILEGNHSDIDSRGRHLVTLGTTMEETAASLKKISEGTTQIADSVDAIRETAGEIDGDLTDASVRYKLTGETLKSYAAALQTAHQTINPLIDEIESAHQAAETARTEANDAKRDLEGLDTTWIWETEPTEADRTKAAAASSSAASAATTAESSLDELWVEFETAFGSWLDAYDTAVNDIEQAMETAGNNDGAWEALDDFLEVLGWVITALAFVGLFLTGPIALFVLALVVALSVLSLILHIVQVANGRGSVVDIVIDVIGLATFGVGAVGARSVAAALRGPAIRNLVTGGRNALQAGFRSQLPNVLGFRRMMDGVAFLQSRVATIGPVFANPWKTIRFGDLNTSIFHSFATGLNQNFGRFPQVAAWASSSEVVAAMTVPVVKQVLNTAVYTGGLVVDGLDKFGENWDAWNNFDSWANEQAQNAGLVPASVQ